MTPDPKTCVVIGTGGSGKSYLLGWIAAHLNRDFRVIVSTHPDESYVKFHGFNDRTTDFRRVGSGSAGVSAGFLADAKKRRRTLWLSIGTLTGDEVAAFMGSLARAVLEIGNLGVFVDEAHQFCASDVYAKDFERMIRAGRQQGVDVFLGTHGIKDIDYRYRKTIQQLVVFRLTEGLDLGVLQNEYRIPKPIVDTIADLPPRYHVFLNRRYPSRDVVPQTI